ncbi:MAG: chorismate lyase [Burkholderiales bacterium]
MTASITASCAWPRWATGVAGLAPRGMRRWLIAPGSLTAHLAAAFGPVTVELLHQGRVRAWPDERRALGLTGPHGVLHGREVLLRGADGRPWVLARSVLAGRHARLVWRGVRGLGTRPLADLLFGPAAAQRSPLMSSRFTPCSAPMRWAQRRWPANEPMAPGWGARSLAARRSVFRLRGAPLLVMECFAPEIGHVGIHRPAKPLPTRRRR